MSEHTEPVSPIVTGDDYLKLPSAPETWLVEGLVPSGGSLLLYGDPKVGKSYAAMQLSIAIANGTEWLGFPARPGKVVYIQLDTPRSLWQKRMRDLHESGVDGSMIFQADRETLPYPYDILQPDHQNLLRSSLVTIKPDVVVMDTIRMCHSQDENDSTTIKNVYSELVKVAAPAALIIVAHARKQGDNGADVINDNRGSNFLVGAVDAIVKMHKHTIYYAGRAIEDSSKRVKRMPNFFWELNTDESEKVIESIINDSSLLSQAERIRELSIALGITEVAAKKRLQRRMKTVGEEVTPPEGPEEPL